jgi:hypothetical protein
MKKFIIHIGYPKTATTTIQKNIFMKYCSSRYMGKKYIQDEISNNLDSIIDSLLFDSETIFDIKLSSHIEIIKSYAKNINDKIIISNEILSKKYYQIIIARLDRLFNIQDYSKCEIIITLRNQKELIFSQYIEKYKGNNKKFNEYLQNGLSSPYDNCLYSVYDFYEIYQAYSLVFGKSSVHILLYEDLKYNPKIFSMKLSDLINVDESLIYNVLATKKENIKKKDKAYFFKKISINNYFSRMYQSVNIDFLSQKNKNYIKKIFSNILIEKKIAKITINEENIIDKYFEESNTLLTKYCDLDLEKYNYPLVKRKNSDKTNRD